MSQFRTMSISEPSFESSTGKFRKLAAVLLVIGLILAVVGVVFIAVGVLNKSCGEASKRAEGQETGYNRCGYSKEAKRAGFGAFLDKVKRTYFELHPSKSPSNTDKRKTTGFQGFMQHVKSTYTAYNPLPKKIKERTDIAWKLLEEIKNLDIDKEKLKAREKKALVQVKLFLKQVFGSPYEVNYYTGDWMLGPDSFCYSRVCYIGYDLYGALLYYRPRSLKDVELLKTKLLSHKVAVEQFTENMKMGIRKGIVRNVESCKAGIDAVKQNYLQIALFNETGVLKEWFVSDLMSPAYYINITPAMNKEWKKTHNNLPVNESMKQYLVEYVGKPIFELLRYLQQDHLRHCVPSSVSSGLATLPLKYVYTDGVANHSWPTDPTLPLTDKVLDGKKSYEMIMPYFTTNNMTPIEVNKLGYEMLDKLYPKAVQVAREVTKIYNDNTSAIIEFRRILNSSESYFNKNPFPQNESNEEAHKKCSDKEGAKKYCPTRWQTIQKWFEESRKVMSLLDPKTVNMFYFTGAKHTTPNCPVDLKPDLNPSSGAQSYSASSKTCTRSASYYIPFFLERMGPRFSEWTTNAHEARPGHHLQVQGSIEHFGDSCKDSIGWLNSRTYYTAFDEGWGLYAESPLIAEDTDTYNDEPMQRYGMLQMQIWRAIRLVVDTGLHYTGMTRSQALQIHSEKAWDDTDIAKKEVTRYQSVAGQATAYMIGQLDFKKNRDYASKQLGKTFDLRDFHYQVLSQGSLPLEYLSDHIHRYVECKKDSTKTGCSEVLNPPNTKPINSPERSLEEDVLRPIKRPETRHFV